MRIRILDRYILANHIGPYFFSLAIITFVFVMDFIIRYLTTFISTGVNLFTVLEFFTLSLGHMFALIIPMAVMPATLMAFGQLTSDNEVTAMKSSGVSLYRMIVPVLIATGGLGVGLVFYNNMLLPESNHRLMNLMIDIGRMKPTLQIKENIFSDALEGYSILIREKNDKTGEIKGVQIFEKTGGAPRSIIASSGKMIYQERESVLRFELIDGEIHEMPNPADIKTYRRTLFKTYAVNIQDTDRTIKRSERAHRGEREMSAAMMEDKIREYEGIVASIRSQTNQIALDHIVSIYSRVIPDIRKFVPGASAPPPTPEPGRANATPNIERESEQIQMALETKREELESYWSQINRYWVEIHKKYAIPFSCIIFVLLGAPLAIRSGKKGMTMSIGFSIFFFLIYYIFLISGEKLADRGYLQPWLSMWLANMLFFVVALFLIRQTNREVRAINWARFNPLQWWRHENP
jgi:lipopolysaccharide export system permease protein